MSLRRPWNRSSWVQVKYSWGAASLKAVNQMMLSEWHSLPAPFYPSPGPLHAICSGIWPHEVPGTVTRGPEENKGKEGRTWGELWTPGTCSTFCIFSPLKTLLGMDTMSPIEGAKKETKVDLWNKWNSDGQKIVESKMSLTSNFPF